MKTIVAFKLGLIITGILSGTYVKNGEICKKYMVYDFKDTIKNIYIIDNEEWNIGDTINIPDSIWNKAETYISFKHTKK